jgi:hypothetical protein
MARRRRRRKNPTGEEILTLVIGAVGGGLAVALYYNAVAQSQNAAALGTGTAATGTTGTTGTTG